ncbi:hypothetical protein J5Y03_09990 [Bacillus sp. RG28]|uniref:Uncharacterized protein n=1 Tax=Gottfriedia endophytica TaxID=2820819 RepID=A0A940NJV6_9BACI|nr:hypothetical protein [Gottfriedia endophytica]MBP0725517.1 hypothetical protein [Gottfriedia endophytica]
MEFVLFILFLCIAVGAFYMAYLGFKKQKQINEKGKQLGAESVVTALHIEGLGISNNEPCELYTFKDRILIESQFKKMKFEIKLEKLRAAVVKTEKELIEKNKSVVGRALIGSLIVPGLGTIVGGMSGVGTKTKKGPSNTYLILNYLNSNGELDAVTFKNNFNLIAINKFCSTVNKSIVIVNQDSVIEL